MVIKSESYHCKEQQEGWPWNIKYRRKSVALLHISGSHEALHHDYAYKCPFRNSRLNNIEYSHRKRHMNNDYSYYPGKPLSHKVGYHHTCRKHRYLLEAHHRLFQCHYTEIHNEDIVQHNINISYYS